MGNSDPAQKERRRGRSGGDVLLRHCCGHPRGTLWSGHHCCGVRIALKAEAPWRASARIGQPIGGGTSRGASPTHHSSITHTLLARGHLNTHMHTHTRTHTQTVGKEGRSRGPCVLTAVESLHRCIARSTKEQYDSKLLLWDALAKSED